MWDESSSVWSLCGVCCQVVQFSAHNCNTDCLQTEHRDTLLYKSKGKKRKKKSQGKFNINFLPRRIYVRRQDSEPQKGRLSILPGTGIDLKGFAVSTFINILSNIFISLLPWFIGLYFCHSDIALPFPSSLTYFTSDVLSASVYQFVFLCRAK